MSGKRDVWSYKFAKCPFFIGLGEKNTDKHIICEGVLKGTTIHLVFKGVGKRDELFKGVCCVMNGYKQCPYYKLNDGEYINE